MKPSVRGCDAILEVLDNQIKLGTSAEAKQTLARLV
jgi:hypothetical protein